jgi:hypothetical protein
MKHMIIIGLFIGGLLAIGYQSTARAAPTLTPGFAKSDSMIEKAYYYGRGVARRTSRRVYRRHHYY